MAAVFLAWLMGLMVATPTAASRCLPLRPAHAHARMRLRMSHLAGDDPVHHLPGEGRAPSERLPPAVSTPPRALDEMPPPVRFDAWAFAWVVASELWLMLRAQAITSAQRAIRARNDALADARRRRVRVEPREVWTLDELRRYDGKADEAAPILLAADGDVFDVSAARNFYGAGGEYSNLAGRDATRLLARMRTEDEPPDEAARPLSLAERVTLAGWLYTLRSKYEVVGRLAPLPHRGEPQNQQQATTTVAP